MLNRIILWVVNDLLGEEDWDFDCIEWGYFFESSRSIDEYSDLYRDDSDEDDFD